MPTEPAPFARQRLTEDMLTTRTPAGARMGARTRSAPSAANGQFVPLGTDKQTIVFPGFDGGAEWGGPAVDPSTSVLYVNANEMAWTGGLGRQRDPSVTPEPRSITAQCAICHGVNRAGSPPAFPSLIDVTDRLSDEQISQIVAHGRGRMPAFPNLDPRR